MQDKTSDVTIKIIALLLLMVGVLAGLSAVGSKRIADENNTSQQANRSPGPRVPPLVTPGTEQNNDGTSQKQSGFSITGAPLKVLKLPALNLPPVSNSSRAGGQTNAVR